MTAPDFRLRKHPSWCPQTHPEAVFTGPDGTAKDPDFIQQKNFFQVDIKKKVV